jgi:putative endonuclease
VGNVPESGADLCLTTNPKMRFHYVYVLHNPLKDFIYVGYSENLTHRLKEHRSGKVRSTKPYRPLNLIFYEAYAVKSDAKRREKYLKSNKGKTTLLTMLKDYFDKPRTP